MENASKALIMAASILLSVMILTLVVYLFVTFGARAREAQGQVADQQMIQFNSQFTVYANRSDIKIHDIITLANLAKQNNDENTGYANFDEEYKITIHVNEIPTQTGGTKSIDIPKKTDSNDYNGINELRELLTSDTVVYNSGSTKVGELQYLYESSEVSYHNNGRFKEITFTRHKNT